MSLQRITCCSLLVLLLKLAADVRGDALKEKRLRPQMVDGQWRKVFDEENRSPFPVTHTRSFRNVLSPRMTDEWTIKVTHSIAETGISVGDKMKIISIDFSYSFNGATTIGQVSESGIHSSREESVQFTVPAQSRLVGWQFVVRIDGVDFVCDLRFTVTNSSEVPRTVSTSVKIRLIKQIQPGHTRFRIRHKTDGRNLTVVSRRNWPAATLGHSDRYHFILSYSDGRGVRIRTLTTEHPGYEYMYSSFAGGIYFDINRDYGSDFNGKQYWHMSKQPPLYDGDAVTFQNKYYDDSYLSHYPETSNSVDVYCIQGRNDEWILDVV